MDYVKKQVFILIFYSTILVFLLHIFNKTTNGYLIAFNYLILAGIGWNTFNILELILKGHDILISFKVSKTIQYKILQDIIDLYNLLHVTNTILIGLLIAVNIL